MTAVDELSPSWFKAEYSQYNKDIWKPQATVRVRDPRVAIFGQHPPAASCRRTARMRHRDEPHE
jgi:hypothetical protein